MATQPSEKDNGEIGLVQAPVFASDAEAEKVTPIGSVGESINGSSKGSDPHGAPADNNPVIYTLGQDGKEEVVTEDDGRVKDIPPYVRRIVSFTDDTTLPTITFRYFLLVFLFVTPGAFLSQMAHYRTTYAPYSVFFVQIASNYVGIWLARILPEWNVKVPFTKRSFSLNPGPFSVKEHVLVTISAASGATYNLGYTPISMSELYFGQKVNPAVAIFFMWAIVWVGYSYAALARQFLIHDPYYPWFQSYVSDPSQDFLGSHMLTSVGSVKLLSLRLRRSNERIRPGSHTSN